MRETGWVGLGSGAAQGGREGDIVGSRCVWD